MVPSKYIFKLVLLLFIISTVSSKTLVKRSVTEHDENEVDNNEFENLKNAYVKLSETLKRNNETSKEKILDEHHEEKTTKNGEKSVNPEDNNKEQEGILQHRHEILDPTASTNEADITRESRTTTRLEVESPAQLIENFRNKLKAARSNLESTLARKAAEPPRLSLFDNRPNPQTIQITHPTLSSLFGRTSNINTETNPTISTPKPEEKKIITSPILDSSSASSEEHKTIDKTVASGKTRQNNEETEDISHLLHVREEINKIRHMMQVLREQQIRQQLGPQFANSKNLTLEETKEFSETIDRLKEEGKISTNPLPNPEEGFQNHPPETTKLIEDIKKLKQSILIFANQVQGPKSHIGSIEELEKQIQQQREEIDTLKKLVDELQPPRQFPFVKQPSRVKTDLHHELQTLQNILNELLKKEEERERLRSTIASKMRSSDDPKSKDEEIETIMKIVQGIAHPNNKQSNLESKLEKLERNMKDLDNQNQRTRHEMLLQKLEQDIKLLKARPNSSNNDDLKEKVKQLEEEIKKTGPLQKISALEKKLDTLNPESRKDLSTNIEKELDKLQMEIDLMALKNLEKNKQQPMSSRQLEGLFTEILNSATEDNEPSSTINHLKPILPLKKLDAIKDIHTSISKPDIPIIPEVPKIIEKPTQPIFQIPFCLHKYTNGQPYIVNNPDYHSDVSKVIGPSKEIKQGPYTNPQNGYEQPKVQYKPAIHKEVKIDVPTPNLDTPRPGNGYEKYEYALKKEISTPQKGYEPTKNIDTPKYEPPKVNQQNGYNYNPPKQQYQPPKEQYQPPKEQYKPSTPQNGYGSETYQQFPYRPTIPKVSPIKVNYNSPQPNYGYDQVSNQYQQSQQQYKPPCNHHTNIEDEINHLHGMIGNLDEKIQYDQDVAPNYGMYRNKPREKRALEEDYDKKEIYKDLQERLQNLREAIDGPTDDDNEINTDFQRTAYNPDSYTPTTLYNNNNYGIRRRQKFDNLFIKIVKFILHKLEISAPYVVDHLFNGDFYDYDEPSGYGGGAYRMRSSEDGYEEEYNPDQDVQKNIGGMFSNFQGFKGLLGFIPTVLFKLLSNFSSFLTILKRNSFFKNFLFPGGVILLVDGILALLIWWFSTDENHNLLTYQNQYRNISNYVE